MAVVKLLNLLTFSCLAIIASMGPAPVAAVSLQMHESRHNLHRNIAANHRRDTSSTKRCKARATSAAESSSKPTKTSSPKPTQTNTNNGNSGNNSGGSGAGKVGLGWSLGNIESIKNFKSWKVSKYYTWSPWCVDDANNLGMECCPMLWGSKQTSDFANLVKPGYAKCAMGPNEPNQAGQSDMSPGDAVSLWWQYLNGLKDHGYYLVSPACTNAPSGKQWMQQFMDACKGCQVDAIALHYYGTSAQDFISYVTDFHNTFGKKIWVTEYACQNFGGGAQCSWDEVFEFMRTVTTWMDSTSYVENYFAFGLSYDLSGVNAANQLINSAGMPTDLAKLYLGL